MCVSVCIRVWGSLCREKNWSWTSDREGGTDGKWNFIHAEKVPLGQLCSWIIVLYVFLPPSVSLSFSLHSVIMLSLLVQNSRSVYLGWRKSDKTVHGEGWSLQFFGGGLFTLHLISLLTHFLHLSFWKGTFNPWLKILILYSSFQTCMTNSLNTTCMKGVISYDGSKKNIILCIWFNTMVLIHETRAEQIFV